MATPPPTEDVDADAYDERDLFGSDEEVPDEKDLFGSDEEIDEKDLFGEDDDLGGIDEKALFGTDDEAEPTPARTPTVPLADAQPPSRAGTIEPSEMDEEEIFGKDLSDDEVGGAADTESVILKRRPMPASSRPMSVLRMPAIIAVEKRPFNPLRYSEDVRTGYKESRSTKDRSVMKLLAPENVIRWRFRKNEDGHILQDDDGRPQYESNTRIVEWEDGSRSLHVGSEVYQLRSMTDDVYLFEENSEELNVCHGFVKQRFNAIPRSLDSKTHDSVKMAQFRKFEPSSKTLLISTEDQAILAQQRQLADEQQKRKEIRDRRAAKLGESPQDNKMSAAFLEDDKSDEGGDGPSVKRPKVA